MRTLLNTVQGFAKRSPYTRDQSIYKVGPAGYTREYLVIDFLGSVSKHGVCKVQLCFNLQDKKLVCTPTYIRRDGYPMYHGKQELRGKLLRREIRKMCKSAEFPEHVADRTINFLNTLVG